MATKNKKESPVKNQIKTDLFSNDEKKVLKALEKVKKKGDASFIEPIFALAVNTPGTISGEEIKQTAEEILNSLKISDAKDELFRLMKDENYEEHRHKLLSHLWNSGFFPTDKLLILTNYVLTGDFQTALEALTVIENMEAPFDDVQLAEALGLTKTHLLTHPNEETNDLVMSLYDVLSRFQHEE